MSRIDMMAPSTTTPATSSTRLSSLSGAVAAGGWAEPEGREGSVVVTGPAYGLTKLRRTHIHAGAEPRAEHSQGSSDSMADSTRGSSGTTVGVNLATTEP